ncbi:uncharacterized protein LOC130825321 [Amaranthus tricolor]|uniref:uncharacterized protein LOC130825321 n=1 Tax=Amaranthus tricolor TaxID=29722 RepID=UPI00258C51F7|nr:uncharacterized protein LOC130825321 [Amaranthus tricolor]XP_057546466.1 uncharacterized protein LOC130825321 [Amaranthus tricolor]
MTKKAMHDVGIHNVPICRQTKEGYCSTHSRLLEKCKHAKNMLQDHEPDKDKSSSASQAFVSELMQFPCSDFEMEQKVPTNLCRDIGAPLEASDRRQENNESFLTSSISKTSDSRGDDSGKSTLMIEKVISTSGAAPRSQKHVKETSLFETLREHDISLSNMSLKDPFSLSNVSQNNSLINLLSYFPQKAPSVSSRKKLLILDINGILADIVYPPPKGYKADTKIAGRAVFTRPFCSDFLKFCLERFNVAIWSSRSRKIIERLINYLLGDMKDQLIFSWDLSYCTESNFRTLENRHKALVFKELRKVWEIYDPELPWKKGEFNESNTLLLDDTPYKALLNPPYTAIFPYSYDFKDRADDAIGPGGKIRAYLEELAMADNVQEYIEQHPFGQSAITERSLSWQFYDKVIKEQTAVAAGS